MCMEDIRIGRELEPDAPRQFTIVGGEALLCGADQNRTRLIVSTDGADVVQLSPAYGSGSVFGVWTLTVATPSVVLRVEDWGKLVTMAWRAQCLVGPVIVTVLPMGTHRQ